MAKVTMVHGPLAAGKTTVARQLESTGAVRLSVDEWMIAASGDRRHVDETTHERVVAQLMHLWQRLVVAGVDVILDFGFWQRPLRDAVRTEASSLGATVGLISVQCDEAERRERCLQRTKEERPDSYDVDSDAFDWIEANRSMDPLGEDEPHRIVDTTSPPPS